MNQPRQGEPHTKGETDVKHMEEQITKDQVRLIRVGRQSLWREQRQEVYAMRKGWRNKGNTDEKL